MNLEHAYLSENIADCEARIAANKAWQRVIDGCLTSGREIHQQHETSADTPRGLLKVATDGERNGRLAWVPGAIQHAAS